MCMNMMLAPIHTRDSMDHTLLTSHDAERERGDDKSTERERGEYDEISFFARFFFFSTSFVLVGWRLVPRARTRVFGSHPAGITRRGHIFFYFSHFSLHSVESIEVEHECSTNSLRCDLTMEGTL